MNTPSLTRFAWISICAALITMTLKAGAYYLTGSVSLLSDALESIINLVAAIIALSMLKLAEKPPDEDHMYGHNKAEYFSSTLEGVLICIAAISIGFAAVERMLNPQEIDQTAIGLVVSGVASAINLFVALHILRAGNKYGSITLKADAHHLLTDVWTSVGVIGGLIVVAITGLSILDPIIALLVAINIVFTGWQLMKQSAQGLMDMAIPREETKIIEDILQRHCVNGITYHGLRTRQSATRRFASVHILVPGKWTVKKGHDFSEVIEAEIRKALRTITVSTHIEPVEDPASMEDITIDRT